MAGELVREALSAAARRQARALRLVTCLQSGPTFSAKELARHLNVSRRTVFRDLNLLREAGIPVHFDREHEAYRVAPAARRAAPLGLRDEDAAALVVATHLSPLHRFPEFSAGLREAAAKLLSIYPYQTTAEVSRLLHACRLADGPPRPSARAEQLLQALFQAIRRRRRVRLTICTGGARLQTKFAPYRILAALDHWEVTGRSSYHRAVKTFALSELLAAEPTSDPYAVPRGYRHRP